MREHMIENFSRQKALADLVKQKEEELYGVEMAMDSQPAPSKKEKGPVTSHYPWPAEL